ncbi:RHS repeat domain-containing protein [Paenibacillus sp. 481]|uniref:RHS repeat domain-containing protein n=1 Tax=Paenibacillus sp. 481 TaxID=2835869 RepID=UPI001E533D59|nr:RHS repeat domain-containing protein [Paenibacillus sp. 481]UHA73730.1 RHS repeat protein [Paenibacillus sp. 481]
MTFYYTARKKTLLICFMFIMFFVLHHKAEASKQSEQKLNYTEISSSSEHFKKWEMLDPSIGHQTGRAEGDGWSATIKNDKPGFLSYGPYVNNLNLGEWVTTWSLKVDTNQIDNKKVARLEVFDPDTLEMLAFQEIERNQFTLSNTYQDFYLKFKRSRQNQRLEFRVFWYGEVNLQLKHITANQITKVDTLKTWNMTDDGIGHNTGRKDGANWSATPQQDKEGHLNYGPYVRDLATGTWETSWSLMIDNHTADNAKVARLEVYDYETGKILASREISRKQFSQPNTTQYFDLKFTNLTPSHRLEFRVYWYGNAKITVKNISTMKTVKINYQKSWKMNDSTIGHNTGRVDGDGWAANTQQDKEGHLNFGPYARDLPVGTWEVSWPLLIDNNVADNEKVARLEVYDYETGEILAFREIHRQQLDSQQFKNLKLRFNHTNTSHRLEFRTYWYGNAYIKLKDVQIKYISPSLFGEVWNMFDPAISHQIGKNIEGVWSVDPIQDKIPGYMSYGPYEKNLSKGTWTVTWSMMLEGSNVKKGNLLRLEVYNSGTGEILASKTINSQQFMARNHFQNFDLQFQNNADAGQPLEFKVFWYGDSAVKLRNIKISQARLVDEYVYDKNGRLIQWIQADGKQKYYEYDPNGNVLRTIRANE